MTADELCGRARASQGEGNDFCWSPSNFIFKLIAAWRGSLCALLLAGIKWSLYRCLGTVLNVCRHCAIEKRTAFGSPPIIFNNDTWTSSSTLLSLKKNPFISLLCLFDAYFITVRDSYPEAQYFELFLREEKECQKILNTTTPNEIRWKKYTLWWFYVWKL